MAGKSEFKTYKERLIESEKPQYVKFTPRLFAGTIDVIISSLLITPFLPMLGTLPEAYVQLQQEVLSSPHMTMSEFLPKLIDYILNRGGIYHFANWFFQGGVLGIVIVWFWIKKAATPGKMLFRIRIVDADTMEPPTAKQCIVRYLGYILSAIFMGIGFMWIAIDKRNQGWHDKLANTLVVKKAKKALPGKL
jgi:uncharacterized RDD family membrane protein YckC